MKKTLEKALPIVAAAFGDRMGVDVVVKGDSAYTDGQQVVVPVVPEDYSSDVLFGYLAHECAHVRYTDFNVQIDSALVKHLTNILEDARIELLMMATYPGTKRTLFAIDEYAIDEKMYDIPKKDTPPAGILCAYCLYNTRVKTLGQEKLSAIAEKTNKVFEDTFPTGVQVRVGVFLQKVAHLTSTSDAMKLSLEILKMIKEEQEKEQKKADQNQQQGNGQGQNQQQGNGQGQNQQQGNGQGQNQQQGKGQGQNQQQGKGAGAGLSPDQAAQLLNDVLNAGSSDLPTQLHDKLKEQLEQNSQLTNDPGKYSICTKAKKYNGDQTAGRELLSKVKADSSRIRTQLAGIVQSKKRVKHSTKSSGRKLKKGKLHRIAAGNTKIFQNKANLVAVNTAVHLSIDLSGSMKGSDEIVAREAAMALSIALEGINGVNPGVSYFAGSDGDVFDVLPHGQRVAQHAARFVRRAGGGTPMASALWYAASQLLKTKEERKIIIVVTDGSPMNRAATEEVIGLCKNSDIEVIGIGVGSAGISDFVDNHIFISSVGDLHKTLFGLMSNALVAAA